MQKRVTNYPFDHTTLNSLSNKSETKNWPVVYILESSKEAYVGETTSALRRMRDHLENTNRKVFKHVFLIDDPTFNKSATLDIESKLIEYIAADGKYTLQNSNRGLRNHNYYNKKIYEEIFYEIWDELIEKKVAKNSLHSIQNSDLFKFSPYKSLTEDQERIVKDLYNIICNDRDSINIIDGEPGSGKTILAIYLVKYLVSDKKTKHLKIGIVLPQTALRGTVKKIFSHVSDLKGSMVLGPNDVVNSESDFDVIIVDEAHRLSKRKNLANYSTFDDACKKLNLDPNSSSQLDWMTKKSRHTILLYDQKQTVKPSDVDKKAFEILKKSNHYNSELSSQLRVLAGEHYSNYIDNIFRKKQTQKESFSGYDFRLFESLSSLIEEIKALDAEFGLCRVVAGYAWDWISKENPDLFDIEIDDCLLRWNSVTKDWINSKHALHEIGCIHTVQGYDLNYTGVIIGPELTYENHEIVFHPEHYKDRYGKHKSLTREEMITYIINIYKTLMTRGIKGTFVYACDDALHQYLTHYIPVENDRYSEKIADNTLGFYKIEK